MPPPSPPSAPASSTLAPVQEPALEDRSAALWTQELWSLARPRQDEAGARSENTSGFYKRRERRATPTPPDDKSLNASSAAQHAGLLTDRAGASQPSRLGPCRK